MSDKESLTRPIVGIENRTPAEVFDIMCDRIARRLATEPRVGDEKAIRQLLKEAAARGYALALGCGNDVNGEPTEDWRGFVDDADTVMDAWARDGSLDAVLTPAEPGVVEAAVIDRGAQYLRETQQAGKCLTPWSETPKATKKKWLALSEGVLHAALRAPVSA